MATNRVFADGRKLSLTCTDPTTPTSGSPVRIGMLTGVALTDERADGTTSVDLGPGVYDLSVAAVNDEGNSAVAVGDEIFYVDADTPKLSKKNAGYSVGFAIEAVTSGATATINVLVLPFGGIGGTAELGAALLSTAAIIDDAVTNAKLANMTRGTVKVGGAADAPTDLDANDAGKALIGDGTDILSQAITGDATLSGAGVLALRNGIIQVDLLAGVDETMTPTYTLAAMAEADEIIFVGRFTTAASIASLVDRTAHFDSDAGALGVISNATDETNNQLMVIWRDVAV